jgi:hypothetical protein
VSARDTGPAATARRVIGVAPPPGREPSPLDGGLPWVSGVLAGAQAAALSLAVVVVPAIAVFVVTSADPANAGVAWTRAVEVGAAFWLLAHGVPYGAVTLVPLGLTALAWYAAYASARRSARPVPSALLAGIGTYVVLVVVVGALVPGASVPRAALGGVLVGTYGLGIGSLRRGDADPLRRWLRQPWSLLPAWLRAGVAGGVAASGVLVLLAALTAAGWVLAGRDAIVDVVHGLDLDTVGGPVLAIAELGYAPNLVAWAAAWLAGPGFAVGAGSHFAASGVVAGALPAVPLLGALPTNDVAGGATRWAPGLLVVAGLAAGLVVHRRLVAVRAWQPVAAALAAGVVAGLLDVMGVGAAGGAVGIGRMAAVGAAVWAVGGLAAAGAALGAGLVAPLADPVVRTRLRAVVRRSQPHEGASGGRETHDDLTAAAAAGTPSAGRSKPARTG